jgi:hypothetical protein
VEECRQAGQERTVEVGRGVGREAGEEERKLLASERPLDQEQKAEKEPTLLRNAGEAALAVVGEEDQVGRKLRMEGELSIEPRRVMLRIL